MPLPISFYNIKHNWDSKSESAQMIFLVCDTSSPLVACTCEATIMTYFQKVYDIWYGQEFQTKGDQS